MTQIRQRIRTTVAVTPFEKALEKELQSFSNELSVILNKGLKFGDNFNAQIIAVSDTGLVDTEFVVAHTLKTVPIGFIVIKNNKAGVVYDSGTAWTASNIYLKCSIANCALSIIFLL